MTDKNRFTLWYYDQDDYNEVVLVGVEVLVPAETFKQMQLHKQPAFYKFCINDGEVFYIAAEFVHSLRQVFNNQSS